MHKRSIGVRHRLVCFRYSVTVADDGVAIVVRRLLLVYMRRAGYDGGDCCEESCVDNDFRCADTTIFYCVDPDYTEEEFPWHLCNPGTRGNGYCNSQNNKPECGTMLRSLPFLDSTYQKAIPMLLVVCVGGVRCS